MIPRDWTPGSKEWAYERLTWQERLERRPSDYEPPQASSKPSEWLTIENLETNADYMLNRGDAPW